MLVEVLSWMCRDVRRVVYRYEGGLDIGWYNFVEEMDIVDKPMMMYHLLCHRHCEMVTPPLREGNDDKERIVGKYLASTSYQPKNGYEISW